MKKYAGLAARRSERVFGWWREGTRRHPGRVIGGCWHTEIDESLTISNNANVYLFHVKKKPLSNDQRDHRAPCDEKTREPWRNEGSGKSEPES